MIPPEYILEHESMTGTTNAMRSVYVRHGGGGDVQYQTSKVQLWSYSQGQHALMGDSVDCITSMRSQGTRQFSRRF